MPIIKLTVIAIGVSSVLFGCTPAHIPYMFLQYGKELRTGDLGKVIAENRLEPNENVKLITLGQGQGASHHMVQVRDRESPHMHKAHDATVIMVRGRGYLFLDSRKIFLAAGDIAHIPRGIPHYYVNTDLEPTVALIIFAPPFDGKDNIPVKSP